MPALATHAMTSETATGAGGRLRPSGSAVPVPRPAFDVIREFQVLTGPVSAMKIVTIYVARHEM